MSPRRAFAAARIAMTVVFHFGGQDVEQQMQDETLRALEHKEKGQST